MNKHELLSRLHLEDPFKDFVANESSVLWGWNGDRPILNTVVGTLRPKLIIEVGTWLGLSTYTFGKAIRQYGLSDSSVLCVDTWLGSKEHWSDPELRKHLKLKHGYPSFYFDFLSNMKNQELEDVIVPLSLPSLIAARYLNDLNIKADLIYIDGSHDKKDVYDDLQAYWMCLDDGGTIFGDDWPIPSVASAVEEFCTEKKLTYRIDGINWIINKIWPR